MPIQLQPQLFRVVSKNNAPKVRHFENNSVLNFTVVPVYSKDADKEQTLWIQCAVWGTKNVEKWATNIEHNDILLIAGSFEICPNPKSTDDNRLMGYPSLNADAFSMRKVQPVALPKPGDTQPTQATEEVVAAKIAASSSDELDEIPF